MLSQAREAEYQREKQQQAAIKLQKHYKGYRYTLVPFMVEITRRSRTHTILLIEKCC